jgi:hypothetical protein
MIHWVHIRSGNSNASTFYMSNHSPFLHLQNLTKNMRWWSKISREVTLSLYLGYLRRKYLMTNICKRMWEPPFAYGCIHNPCLSQYLLGKIYSDIEGIFGMCVLRTSQLPRSLILSVFPFIFLSLHFKLFQQITMQKPLSFYFSVKLK